MYSELTLLLKLQQNRDVYKRRDLRSSRCRNQLVKKDLGCNVALQAKRKEEFCMQECASLQNDNWFVCKHSVMMLWTIDTAPLC